MGTETRLEVPVYAHEGLLEAFSSVVLAGVRQDEFSAQAKVLADSEGEIWEQIEATAVAEGKILPEALDPELCKEVVLRGLRSQLFGDAAKDIYTAKWDRQREVHKGLMRVAGLKVSVKAIDPARPAIHRVDSPYVDRTYKTSVVSECSGNIHDVGEFVVGEGHFLIVPRFRDGFRNFWSKNYWYRVCPVDLKTGEPLVEISSNQVWNTRYEYPQDLASSSVVGAE